MYFINEQGFVYIGALIIFNPLLHDLFFSSFFLDIALDRLLSSIDS